MTRDVPSPIDLRDPADALAWEATAMSKRPWRTDFFRAFASAIESSAVSIERILELGSGPGFLAEYLLQALPGVAYVALDSSLSMHRLAARRLGVLGARVQFVERSFADPGWTDDLGRFSGVVTLQAVHEVRHKRHAAALHAQVREILAPSGQYLVCDHVVGEGGMTDDRLYMTAAEQRAALHEGGFASVEPLLALGGLVLHRAT